MVRKLLLAATLALAARPALAQEVRGDATAGLVSKTAKAEVHLIADPVLNNHRLVLKVVILNLSGTPQAFGPDGVRVTAGEVPVALASRDTLLAEMSDGAVGNGETAQAHTTAALPITNTGQPDVSGFTGGMGGGTAGVPSSTVNRAQRRPNLNAAAQLDAVLLKPITVRPNSADGGQVLTEQLKRSKTPEVTVAIAFAGESHRFAVKVPR